MTNKQVKWLGIAGSVASIIGLWLVFFPYSNSYMAPSTLANSPLQQTLTSLTAQQSKGDCSPNMIGVHVGGNINSCAPSGQPLASEAPASSKK